jgi:hypothetical protein
VLHKQADVSKMRTASIMTAMITLMTQAANTSETSVNFYEPTRRATPQGCHVHTRRRYSLKSHSVQITMIL